MPTSRRGGCLSRLLRASIFDNAPITSTPLFESMPINREVFYKGKSRCGFMPRHSCRGSRQSAWFIKLTLTIG